MANQQDIVRALAYATEIVGIPEITAETAPEFAARVALVQVLNGPLGVSEEGPFPIDAGHVVAYIGQIKTEAEKQNRNVFYKRQITTKLDEVARIVATSVE